MSASPGAGLHSILGNCAGDAAAASRRERRATATGSSHMSGEQDVKLYMYDLSKGLAQMLLPMLGSWWSKDIEDFDGVWHTSVVVFGQEYYFNGDLVHVRPGDSAWGEPTKVVSIGYTPCSRKALHQFVVSQMRPLFNRSSYDALNNNCNHFCECLTMYLCDRHIPGDILQQPKKLAELPGLQLLRPFLDRCLGGGLTGPADCEMSINDCEDEDPGSPSGRIARSSKELPGSHMFTGLDDSVAPSCRSSKELPGTTMFPGIDDDMTLSCRRAVRDVSRENAVIDVDSYSSRPVAMRGNSRSRLVAPNAA